MNSYKEMKRKAQEEQEKIELRSEKGTQPHRANAAFPHPLGKYDFVHYHCVAFGGVWELIFVGINLPIHGVISGIDNCNRRRL